MSNESGSAGVSGGHPWSRMIKLQTKRGEAQYESHIPDSLVCCFGDLGRGLRAPCRVPANSSVIAPPPAAPWMPSSIDARPLAAASSPSCWHPDLILCASEPNVFQSWSAYAASRRTRSWQVVSANMTSTWRARLASPRNSRLSDTKSEVPTEASPVRRRLTACKPTSLPIASGLLALQGNSLRMFMREWPQCPTHPARLD